MKRARFVDEQIVRILQGADRAPVAEVAKRRGGACKKGDYSIDRGVTRRRACTLIGVARSGLVYACKMPMKNFLCLEKTRKVGLWVK
jgi:hypothetical protein